MSNNQGQVECAETQGFGFYLTHKMPTKENLLQRLRRSGGIITAIVCVSLLTDNMLLTLVDPILPNMLINLENVTISNNSGIASQVINENGRYGYLVAAKGAAQFLFNPFVGILVSRFGYRLPMLMGSIVLLASTTAFAFGNSYSFFFVTRVLQGISSSVSAVAGLGLLASTYFDDEERGKAMGIAFGGLSIGITIGPVYGSVLYELWGQAVPFLALAALVFLEIGLQLFTYQKEEPSNKDHSMTSIFTLITDPYIVIVVVNVFLVNLDVSLVLAFLPIHLLDLQNAPTWQLGLVVLPTSIGYLVASAIFPRITKWIKRWLCAYLGLIISAGSLIALAFSLTFVGMSVVTLFLGIAIGMVSTSMQPMLAQLVDLRHASMYGNVYAISDMAVCFSMFLGPLVGGPVVYAIGFEWLCGGVAIINISFTIFSFLLRNPKISQPKMGLLEDDERSSLLSRRSSGSGGRSLISLRSRRSSRSAHTISTLESIPTPRTVSCLSPIETALDDPMDIYPSMVEHAFISSL